MAFTFQVPERSIRVSFYDVDGRRVDNITKKQAKRIDKKRPGIKFYFQDKNGLQRELTIDQVLKLKPEKDQISPSAGGGGCAKSPQPCGPPKVKIFGGEGVGAMINSVISPLSSGVMAFDIVSGGKNYTSIPMAILQDECGSGNGSSLKVIMDGDKVKNIYIPAPGDGFLDKFDGSLGGGGVKWKGADDGYVQTKDGRFYVVPTDQPPTTLNPGDTWYPPYGPPVVIPEDGTVEDVISTPPEIDTGGGGAADGGAGGGGGGAAGGGAGDTGTGGGTGGTNGPGISYPVIVSFDDVVIEDPGFGYRPGDKIVITPDKGTILEPVINDRGEVVNVIVTQEGSGYEDLPKIVVESDTGYNAVIKPILKVKRMNEDEITKVPIGVSLVYVIDCVGLIPPKTTFDILPR